MTRDEAVKVAGIVKTADGGCSGCYRDLAEKLNYYFPEYDWLSLVKESSELWGYDGHN